MANNVIKRIWNQNKMVNIEALQGMAFQAEDGGHTFEIKGVDDQGNPVALSGTVAGIFRRPDNADIALTGTSGDGIVSVTLTDACYAVPGKFGLTIYTTADSKKTAVYAAVGTVASTSGGAVAGDTPQDVVDLINAIESAIAEIPASYTDIMAANAPTYSSSAVYAVGQYAWYNGVLKRCVVPITSGETYTAAHWETANMGNDVADLGDGLITVTDLASDGEYTLSSADFESGTWSYTTKAANSKRIRTRRLIPVKAGSVVSYSNPNMKIYIGVFATRKASAYTQTTGWINAGSSGTVTLTSSGYMVIMFESAADIGPTDYDSTVTLSTKLLDKFIYQGKNKSHNIPAGLTQWFPADAGWTPSSNPKMSPLDIPVNCYCQVAGNIMDDTDGVWFPGFYTVRSYLVLTYAYFPSANARYYIALDTRHGVVWHGVKSSAENFVRWSNDSGYNEGEFAPYVPLQHKDNDERGFTWTWSNSGCYVIGSDPVPAGGIMCYLLTKQNLPDYVKPNERVYVEYETSNPDVFLRIITYDSNDTATSLPIITNSQCVTIPGDAVKWAIRFGSYVGNDLSAGVLISKVSVLSLQNVDKACQKDLRVLFIGNSYTHDCAEYFPFIFKNIAPKINLTCGIAYRGGASIDSYLDRFNNNDAVINYAKYRNNAAKWDRIAATEVPSDELTIKQILADEPWDIITVQQASLSQGTWSSFSNLNTLLKDYAEYIRTTWNKSVKIGYFMPQLRYAPDSTPNYPVTYEDQQTCIQNVWQTTPVDFIIPCGTAIENARGNATLNAIGNGAGGNTGHLVCDNSGHLQQGIGELIPNYVVVAKMLEMCGEPLGILGNPIRPTDAVITAWDVPGKYDSTSDTSQGVTDANCYLAQKCALAAIKKPFEVSTI